VECRLIVYDHGLLLKLLYKFVPHTHTSCVLEKRRAMTREREKACEKCAAARGHFASQLIKFPFGDWCNVLQACFSDHRLSG
jgi:hypothetical protein